MVEHLCAEHNVELPEPTRLRDCQAQPRHFQVLAPRARYKRVCQRCSSFVCLCVLHGISFVDDVRLRDDGLCDTKVEDPLLVPLQGRRV
jgi:hypothetical protein